MVVVPIFLSLALSYFSLVRRSINILNVFCAPSRRNNTLDNKHINLSQTPRHRRDKNKPRQNDSSFFPTLRVLYILKLYVQVAALKHRAAEVGEEGTGSAEAEVRHGVPYIVCLAATISIAPVDTINTKLTPTTAFRLLWKEYR